MQNSERYSFKNLELWQAAQDFAVQTMRLVDALPNQRSADVIARQLIRSATSIAANIAEGHGRFTFGAYRNHLSIAKGSATESQSWIDLLVRLGFLKGEEGKALEVKCEALIAALTRRIVSLERREAMTRSNSRVREDGPDYEVSEVEVPKFPGSRVLGLPGEDDSP